MTRTWSPGGVVEPKYAPAVIHACKDIVTASVMATRATCFFILCLRALSIRKVAVGGSGQHFGYSRSPAPSARHFQGRTASFTNEIRSYDAPRGGLRCPRVTRSRGY